jgi:hypothetical protein
MTAEKDLRDNTRAVNNLTSQMATFNKVAAELNRNLAALVRDGGEAVQSVRSGFQEYLAGAVEKLNEKTVQRVWEETPPLAHVVDGYCVDPRCSTEPKHDHGVRCSASCPCVSEATFETKQIDPNQLVKKVFKEKGFNAGFCAHCIMGTCNPQETVNNWTATGCRCCEHRHSLVS